MVRDYKDIKSTLDKSPMFHLSMASLELFHSNFLYWLSRIDRDLFKDLISRLVGGKLDWPEGWEVHREKYNYDLCVTRKPHKSKSDVWLILENKVKSLPRLEQLEQYGDETKKANGPKILLSLVKEFPQKDKIANLGWKIKSYDDLIKELKTVFKQCIKPYHQDVIEDYCEYMSSLSDLINIINDFEIRSISDINNKVKEWEDYGVANIIKKICYGKMLYKCIDSLNLKKDEIEWEVDASKILENNRKEAIYVNFGITHSTGYFELKLPFDEEKLILVQIQGQYYCRGVAFKEGSVDNRDKIENNSKLKALFSWQDNVKPELNWPDKFKEQNCYRKKGQFWSYKKDGKPDQFVYQKVKFKDSMTPEILSECVIQDIKTFKELLEKNNER